MSPSATTSAVDGLGRRRGAATASPARGRRAGRRRLRGRASSRRGRPSPGARGRRRASARASRPSPDGSRRARAPAQPGAGRGVARRRARAVETVGGRCASSWRTWSRPAGRRPRRRGWPSSCADSSGEAARGRGGGLRLLAGAALELDLVAQPGGVAVEARRRVPAATSDRPARAARPRRRRERRGFLQRASRRRCERRARRPPSRAARSRRRHGRRARRRAPRAARRPRRARRRARPARPSRSPSSPRARGACSRQRVGERADASAGDGVRAALGAPSPASAASAEASAARAARDARRSARAAASAASTASRAESSLSRARAIAAAASASSRPSSSRRARQSASASLPAGVGHVRWRRPPARAPCRRAPRPLAGRSRFGARRGLRRPPPSRVPPRRSRPPRRPRARRAARASLRPRRSVAARTGPELDHLGVGAVRRAGPSRGCRRATAARRRSSRAPSGIVYSVCGPGPASMRSSAPSAARTISAGGSGLAGWIRRTRLLAGSGHPFDVAGQGG